MKIANLVFLLRNADSEVLIAMKKKGFGAGKYNGVGGKVENGETVVESAVREAREEIGVDIAPAHLQHRGEIVFHFDDKPDWDIHVHMYVVREWSGEPVETAEMAPKWCAVDAVPYEEMWIDDIEWLPQVLAGKTVRGEFTFNADGSQILSRKLAFS